ncbi:MAG TPA: LCP family protein [Amycolatopsis sp.]|uniref:LCP family protein n=1 Tax=Amycolatopsis sp. TaxID=37632 RepID=UPI002B47651C|nr:LCP family protein [Amycolatopsis sp.]HKS44050.1 LCP family protein [Amycolatopsis sp.]
MGVSRVAGRVLAGLVSALVLGSTGLGWVQLNRLSGLSTADVIDPGVSSVGAADEQNILLVGLDTRTDAQGNPLPQSILDQLHAGESSDGGDNTDTMILIHIPAGGQGAVAFSIPRDAYVRLAGGYGMHKINSAYTFAQVAAANRLRAQGIDGAQLNVQAAQAGAKNAIQTVEQLTGLTVNHFASVNLVGFYDISEAVGGVPVCLKEAVDDSFSGAKFPAGPQTVAGAQALAFVRQRHGLTGGDLDRIKRQQAFMAGMARTVLSAGTLANPGKLNALIDAVKKNVTLDQGWDVLSFAQQMRNLSAGRIQFETIPVVDVDYKTPDGDSIEVDPAQIKKLVSAVAGPSAPSGPDPSSSPVSPGLELRGPARVTIDVDNGTGITGLAARLMQDLAAHGYTAGTAGNVAARGSTVVSYAGGERAEAEKVAQYLGSGVTVSAGTGLRAGHLRVLLGAGYTGPVSQADTAAVTAPASSTSNTPPAITAGQQNCVD